MHFLFAASQMLLVGVEVCASTLVGIQGAWDDCASVH